MKNSAKSGIVFLVVFVIYFGISSCSSVDINDDKSVIGRMQGTWVGFDHENGRYTHYKLKISGNNFNGWLTTTYTEKEPEWSDKPDEIGTFELSPVQGYTNMSGNYRNINFSKEGVGYSDNSLAARTFTEMIIYDDFSGLYVVSWAAMTKK